MKAINQNDAPTNIMTKRNTDSGTSRAYTQPCSRSNTRTKAFDRAWKQDGERNSRNTNRADQISSVQHGNKTAYLRLHRDRNKFSLSENLTMTEACRSLAAGGGGKKQVNPNSDSPDNEQPNRDRAGAWAKL